MSDKEKLDREKDEDKDKDEVVEEELDMEEVKATASEIVAKPLNVEEFPDKAEAKKRTEEEERKDIEANVLGEFND